MYFESHQVLAHELAHELVREADEYRPTAPAGLAPRVNHHGAYG